MGKRILCGLAFVAAAIPAAAHDFWIQPDRFRIEPGERVAVRFLMGEPGAVEHWATEWRKVAAFQDFAPHGVADLQASLRPLDGREPDLARADAAIRLTAPGTHIVAFASNHAVSDLAADEFNAYAAHEGLALAIAKRRLDGSGNAHGRELYSRRAKLLVQVGETATDTVSTLIGQTLEIVPERNPYLLRAGEPLRVRIWFHGAPLAGASVVMESLGANAVHGTPVISGPDGRVVFANPGAGARKVNVVWSTPITDPRAEFETVFASLSFGG